MSEEVQYPEFEIGEIYVNFICNHLYLYLREYFYYEMEISNVICDMTAEKLNKELNRLRRFNERQQHELEKQCYIASQGVLIVA